MDIHKGLGNANKIMVYYLMVLIILDYRFRKFMEEVYVMQFQEKVLLQL
jgi:hypothetical protein